MSKKKQYPVRIPRGVYGIRAQEQRMGGINRTWWARRWLTILEAMGYLGRLGKARTYALSGQVLSIDINKNKVSAKVQGVRSNPYEIELTFKLPGAKERKRIVGAIKKEPMIVARLLNDDMPTEVESLFTSNGCNLFPGGKLAPGKYDMTTVCSCPDYANPCKHVLATLLILGEEIGRRPMTLLELRGITTEELLT